ncbi:hypothetical protein ACOMHN_061750 [Nucella lapillus]
MAKCFLSKPAVALLLRLILMSVFSYDKGWAASPYQHRLFTKVTHCPGGVLSPAAGYQNVTTRSVLECVSLCGPRTACVSIVFDVDSNVCQLASTRVSHNCSNTILQTNPSKSFERPPDVVCENGSTLSADGQRCTCPQGYYGNACNITVADCDEYFEKGFFLGTVEEIIFIKPPGTDRPFPIPCDHLSRYNSTRTQIAFRLEETFNFNRSWQQYRDGFGDPTTKSFWVGLEHLHHLTNNRDFTLRFRVEANGTLYFQHYNKFVLDDETSDYAFSMNTYVSEKNLGDCLSRLLGAKFSTYDMDHDESADRECAMEHGAGWWFKEDTCSTCNPFGPILSPFNGSRKGVPGESFWKKNLGDIIPFTFRMYLVKG